MTSFATLQSQASMLFRSGQSAEAIVAYQQLLTVKPELPNSWFNLAILLRGAGRAQEALAAYGRALAYNIDEPEEAYLQRAVILSEDLARVDAARSNLATALAINPDYVPALLNLGNLHEDSGERLAAEAAYARALEVDDRCALALARLIGLSLANEECDRLFDQARAFLRQPELSALDRADVGFALGGALDRAGKYDEAFETIVRANSEMRSLAVASGQSYQASEQRRLTDQLITAIPPVPDRAAAVEGSPIFIVGLFRSGSTLVERMLSRHDAIEAGGELDLIPRFVHRDISNYPAEIACPDPALIGTLRSRYLNAVAGRCAASQILTDKRPDNFLHIGLIKQIFPAAKIVLTSRDPIDTGLSIYFLHADPGLAYATDLGDIADYIAQYRRLTAHWRALYGKDIHVVDYDQLVKNPRTVMEPLLEFLGLPWHDAVLRDDGNPRPVRTASNWQVRQPLYRSSSGRWRNYTDQLAGFRALLEG